VDAYVIAGAGDRISPWQARYRSARVRGSENFAVRAVIGQADRRTSQPAGKTKASYRIGDGDLPYPGAWVESADIHTDSWSPGIAAWLGERGGRNKTAPDSLGGADRARSRG
jgi:poly(3-hydroxyalkanoate) synthetase